MLKMSMLPSALCFSSFRKASKVGAIFALVLHTVDICLLIYSIVTIQLLQNDLDSSMRKSFLAPGIDVVAYIALVLSVVAIPVCALQLRWIKKGYERTPHMLLWLWTMVIVRVYEAVIGIYILAFLGADKLRIVGFTSPIAIFGAVYWAAGTGLLAFFCVLLVCYVQELRQENRGGGSGGKRRPKPYKIHHNDVYSPTTCAILDPSYDEKTPPVKKYKSTPKRNRLYFKKEEKRPELKREFESIV